MRKNNKQVKTYFIILPLLLIGVVYAILQTNIHINGTAKIKSNTWDVHFANIEVVEGSVIIGTDDLAATINTENNCKIDFSITLSLPGDFYEFTADIVNAGTIDAMIGTFEKNLRINDVISETPSFLDYTIAYINGEEIEENDLLPINTSKRIKVKIEYKKDIEELPEPTTITASIIPYYLQADSTAVKKSLYYCNYDGELIQGAEYINGQYTYKYKQEYSWNADTQTSSWTNMEEDGWAIMLTDKESTSPVNSIICSYINEKPIVSMWYTFKDSQAISIDLSSIYTTNVTNMRSMFQRSTTQVLDLSHFDTSNVTMMREMFRRSSATEIIGLDTFNTSKVTNMLNMFSMTDVEELDLSSFDTSNVTNMNRMFADSSAHTINLKSFDTSNVISKDGMFLDAAATTVYVRNEEEKTRLSTGTNKPSTMNLIVYNGG